ncbi:MAG: hypothetical protein JW757_14130 [Anaerolineales bacterium]|nr:hypothetical protein [Anaerolineales bacterium]
MSTKTIGVWAFIIGLILALAEVFLDLGRWAAQVLILLGILVGVFHPIRKEIVPLAVVYLAVAATAASIEGLLYLGPIITQIAAAWAQFLGPVVLTAMLIWGAPYLMSKK